MPPTFAKDFIGEDSPATLPPLASMPSLSGLGSLSGGMPTALALALAESTVPAAGASAEGSFLMMLSSEASAPDFAGTSFTRAFLAPHACGPGTIRRRWDGKIALIG